MWMSRAAEQKSRYYKELAEYQQTEDYKRHQDHLRTNKQRDGRLDEGMSRATIKDHSKDGSIKMGASKDKQHATSQQQSKLCFRF